MYAKWHLNNKKSQQKATLAIFGANRQLQLATVQGLFDHADSQPFWNQKLPVPVWNMGMAKSPQVLDEKSEMKSQPWRHQQEQPTIYSCFKSSISAYITALSGGAARSRSIFFASNAKIHGSKCCSSLEIPLHVQHRAASATMDAAAIPISPVKGWQPHARIQEPIATSHEQRHCANNESGLCSFANLEKPWDQAKLTR